MPEAPPIVHGHRMTHVVALEGFADPGRIALLVELPRVHADHHERVVPMPLLERAKRRQDVQAVDAAVGPEVEEDQLAAQLAQRQ